MQEIRKIKRKNLDVEKYSKALNDSLNYRIYAEVWYLDVLTDGNWECWIYGDYEVIMPVPFQLKFGIKFIIMPIYCQQLGVFYKEEIPDELFQKFERKIYKSLVRSYAFNEENTERFQPRGEKRVNYILDLNRPYEEIFENYTKHRRKDIRKSEKLGVQVVESNNYEKFLDLRLRFYKHLDKYADYEFLQKHLRFLIEKKALILCEVRDKDGICIAVQYFIKSKNRILCMGFVRDKINENHNSSAYVNDFMIKNFAETSLIYDLRGSMIEEVAYFMKGFGVEKKFYTVFSRQFFR